MNNWTDYIYFFLTGAALLLGVAGLFLTAVIPGIHRWNKRFFLNFFFVILLSCLFDFIEMILLSFPAMRAVICFLLVLETLLLSLPLPMLTVLLLHCCGKKIRSSKLFHTVLGLYAVFFVMVVSAPFISAFAYITPDNQYYRGEWYPFMLFPMTATGIINLAGVIHHRKLLSHKVFIGLLIALIPLTAAMLVQMFVDVYPFIDISLIISALTMYSLILSDQIEHNLRQQQEIAKQQISITTLEMRPHFIYNTLTSIYCLCNQDSEKARQVILDFMTYLRRNFNAIASSEPIPFSNELEHTRAYLAVEQAQYEDSLFVDYNTPHIWFRIPPLTLQPIVENAVKHGRDPYAGPLHVSIRTRKTNFGSEITVADDGRGFALTNDSEPHIALKNIRYRLEIMCGGKLTITSNDGRGTVVTVTIPDSAAK